MHVESFLHSVASPFHSFVTTRSLHPMPLPLLVVPASVSPCNTHEYKVVAAVLKMQPRNAPCLWRYWLGHQVGSSCLGTIVCKFVGSMAIVHVCFFFLWPPRNMPGCTVGCHCTIFPVNFARSVVYCSISPSWDAAGHHNACACICAECSRCILHSYSWAMTWMHGAMHPSIHPGPGIHIFAKTPQQAHPYLCIDSTARTRLHPRTKLHP